MTETTADISTELDARTIEELQPPCDTVWSDGATCDHPAEHALRVTCRAGIVRVVLYCAPHAERAIVGGMGCGRCYPGRGHAAHNVTVLSAERL